MHIVYDIQNNASTNLHVELLIIFVLDSFKLALQFKHLQLIKIIKSEQNIKNII